MVPLLLMIGIVAIIISGILLEDWMEGRHGDGPSQAESSEAKAMRRKVGIFIGLTGLLAIGVSAVIHFFL
ncbi:hypothetical protein [Bacillus sp. FJAT-45037]|uniref:hypothetical protein n=1 Tax=Bacillus sp. FJAT-45037 TaxID=2011007 RepID=UPI000C2304DC|nr:hypothetical protein [Bacillus sp. FJAT-45037]